MKKYIVISIAPGQEAYQDATVEKRFITSDENEAQREFEGCEFYNTNELWEIDFENNIINIIANS